MRKNKNIEPRNDKGERHGYWETYWSNGNLRDKRFFHNGKEVGYEEWYSYTDKITRKRYNL